MSNTPALSIRLEAALFFKGGTVSVHELATSTKASVEEVEEALTELSEALSERGIRLVREKNNVALATAPETHEMIETMRREELEGPLGKAGLETLAIIMYRGPLSRTDIEYVRGVNCTAILRSLLIRGLIERVENPGDKRSFLYQPTAELPAYLGISSLSSLPGYIDTKNKIDELFRTRDTIAVDSGTTESQNDTHE